MNEAYVQCSRYLSSLVRAYTTELLHYPAQYGPTYSAQCGPTYSAQYGPTALRSMAQRTLRSVAQRTLRSVAQRTLRSIPSLCCSLFIRQIQMSCFD